MIIGPIHIDPESLMALRQVRFNQDMNFLMLGIAVVEFDLAMKSTLLNEAKLNAEDLNRRVGELTVAHMEARTGLLNAVARAEKDQARIGKAALAKLGLDRDDEYYAIETENHGRVLRLLDGYWWQRWEATDKPLGLDVPISVPAEHRRTLH